MSAKISGAVWDLELPTPQLVVLLAMADHADHEGNNVYPSIALIAWKTGYSDRQVKRIVKQLVSAGILVVVAAPKGRVVQYSIKLEAGKKKAPYKSGQNVTSDTATSPLPVTQLRPTTSDIAMSPEPSSKPSEEPLLAPVGAVNAIDDEKPQPSKVVPFKSNEPKKREPKPFEDVPKSDRLAIIQAWYDALSVKPSMFNTDTNHNAAAAIRRDGYSAGHVARYVKAQMNDGYWIGKTLTLSKVAELMPAWIAAHAPRTTNPDLMQKAFTLPDGVRGFTTDQFVRDVDTEAETDVA